MINVVQHFKADVWVVCTRCGARGDLKGYDSMIESAKDQPYQRLFTFDDLKGWQVIRLDKGVLKVFTDVTLGMKDSWYGGLYCPDCVSKCLYFMQAKRLLEEINDGQ